MKTSDTNLIPAENLLQSWLNQLNLPEQVTLFLSSAITFITIILIAIVSTYILRSILLPIILRWLQANRYSWDDALIKNQLLQKASWFIPVLILSTSIDALLAPGTGTYILLKRLVMTSYVIVAMITLTSFLNTVNDIHNLLRRDKEQYIQAYIDAGKIVVYVIGIIFIMSIFTGKSPWGIFSVLGGLTAVTMLIFKDSILGFIASIQLTTTDMVRVGDWIEMSQYGADGDVLSMSIHSIKVQNWDKTITTIPTYAMVSSSFKNWRGMKESGGRRIKRAIHIDINTIKFCDETLLNRLKKTAILKEYLQHKEQEITADSKGVSPESINRRRQTNIGIFRAYVAAYLKNNNNINQNMTFLVRQLPPGKNGLPMEIYVFSKDQVWANYEAIQADIFDHLLASLPEFELRAFQNPTGYDLHLLSQNP